MTNLLQRIVKFLRDTLPTTFLLLAFLLGAGADHLLFVKSVSIGSDTTQVSVVQPFTPNTSPAISVSALADTGKPKVQWKTRIVVDTNDVAHYRAIAEALIAEKELLAPRIVELIEPKTAVMPFENQELIPGSKVFGTGGLMVAYTPLEKKFQAEIGFTKINFPEITNTRRPAWWVKPSIFVLGGLTAHYLIGDNKNHTTALITGTAGVMLILWEF